MTTRKTAKKQTMKKPAARKPATARSTKAARNRKAAATATPVQKLLQAGKDAAQRAQGEAAKVYGAIALEAKRLSEMTNEAAQSLARHAGVVMTDGRAAQEKVAASARAQAAAAAREVKAFAKKSEKAIKQNIGKKVDTALAQTREGVTRLEHVFEARVAKTLNTFGVPSAKEVRELQARMGDLQKALNQLNKRYARA